MDKCHEENDLAVTINADMTVSEQCGIAASKGSQISWLIRIKHVYGEKVNHTVGIIQVIVRPHFEYCIQACMVAMSLKTRHQQF